MALIQITENIFVNPAAVDMVELKVIRGKPSVQIHINGKVKTSDKDPMALMKELGESVGKWEQFRRN